MRRLFFACACVAMAACDESNGDSAPRVRPQIIAASGPKDSVLACDPKASGGSCPLPISVTFRLPKDQFVWKALVRFDGDGSETGVDRGYVIPNTFGEGEGVDVVVTVNAGLPPTILQRGGPPFRYGIRLLTGAGVESTTSTLAISVQ
jgi:hypothetical protein